MKILITGGASGLGEAITRLAATNSQHQVYFTYSRSEDAAKKLETEFANARSFCCDFRDRTSVQNFCNILKTLEIDVLINNAYPGSFLKTHFHKIAVEDYQTNFEHHIIPTILITQAAIEGFRKKKSGKIITILTAALTGLPPIGSSIYVAEKAYLGQLVKVWATENSKFNITSNSVSPSFMLTGLTQSIDERLVEQIKNSHPLNELLTTTEAAESVLYLVNAGPHINGVDLLLNAGVNFK